MDQRGQHIVAVADPGQGLAGDGSLMLLDGLDVGHDLAGMHEWSVRPLTIGGGVRGQLEQLLVRVGADHDRVDVARQDARGVGDGLATTELHVARGDDGVAAQLLGRDLERDPGPVDGLSKIMASILPAIGLAASPLLNGSAEPECGGVEPVDRRPDRGSSGSRWAGRSERTRSARSHGRARPR